MGENDEGTGRPLLDQVGTSPDEKKTIDQTKKSKAKFFAYLNAFAIIMAAIIGGFAIWYIDQSNDQNPLEISSISSKGGLLDIKVRNPSNTDAIIHTILINVIIDYDHPAIIQMNYQNSTKKYDTDISKSTVDQIISVEDVSQRIAAESVDRFEISLNTTRHLLLDVELIYNDDCMVNHIVEINKGYETGEMEPEHNEIERDAFPENKSQVLYPARPTFRIRHVRMG